MADAGDNEDDWAQKVAFMRRAGVVTASFSPDGKLLAAQLGPDPTPSTERETQKHRGMTDEQRRQEIRRITLASGPRLREVPREPVR